MKLSRLDAISLFLLLSACGASQRDTEPVPQADVATEPVESGEPTGGSEEPSSVATRSATAPQAAPSLASLRSEIEPWYRSTVTQDAEARRVAEALLAGTDPDADNTDPRTFMRAVLRDGLLPAMKSDAVVLRAFFRTFNLLDRPDALLADADVGARIFAAWETRDQREPEAPLGPSSRSELLERIAA